MALDNFTATAQGGTCLGGSVCGTVVPVSNPVLLSPYIGLASIIATAIALTAVYAKGLKRKRTSDD